MKSSKPVSRASAQVSKNQRIRWARTHAIKDILGISTSEAVKFHKAHCKQLTSIPASQVTKALLDKLVKNESSDQFVPVVRSTAGLLQTELNYQTLVTVKKFAAEQGISLEQMKTAIVTLEDLQS